MKTIHEEDETHKEWYVTAKKMTLDRLPAFLKELSEDYQHDYGTICHAIAAAAIAAANAIEHSPCGGITGFQESCVMWEFISNWDSSYKDKPLRLLDYSNILYPQYATTFQTISKETWSWIQKEAAKKLSEDNEDVHPAVITHWKSLIEGEVPFNLSVEQ